MSWTKYYAAHKAATLPRCSSINRHLRAGELEEALEAAKVAGLWRLDTRWRNVKPRERPVWLPWMREASRKNARIVMKSL
jgi:hypothetical protein